MKICLSVTYVSISLDYIPKNAINRSDCKKMYLKQNRLYEKLVIRINQ